MPVKFMTQMISIKSIDLKNGKAGVSLRPMERREFLSNGLAATLAVTSDAAARRAVAALPSCTKSAVAVMAELQFPAGTGDRAARAFGKLTVATRAEQGCLRYVVARDLVDPDRFHLAELWDDLGALADHFATPHLAAFSADARALGASASFMKRIHISELADLKPAELEALRSRTLGQETSERESSC